MTPKMHHLVLHIRDPKLHDILRAGGIYGNALRDLYTEAALEALAERIIDLETQCAEAGTYVKENPE